MGRPIRHATCLTGSLASRFAPLAVFLLLPLSGCLRPQKPAGYYGPTDPMAVVVQHVNENNRAIPSLFAHHYTEANIHDPKKDKDTFINAGGDLFVLKPRELLMRGKKDVAGLIFELGSTPDRYWMTVFAGEDTMWWGWHRNSGQPGVRDIPFPPDLLLEVLGIGDINTSFTVPPLPTMRFNNDLDVYMVVWDAPLPDRWYAQKEIWFSRKTYLPLKVLLFDRNGRIILRADLTAHKPIPVPGRPEATWPKIATGYDLFFPETRSTMTIRLSDVALKNKIGNPKPGIIQFPEEPGVSDGRIIQVDKDCDTQPSTPR